MNEFACFETPRCYLTFQQAKDHDDNDDDDLRLSCNRNGDLFWTRNRMDWEEWYILPINTDTNTNNQSDGGVSSPSNGGVSSSLDGVDASTSASIGSGGGGGSGGAISNHADERSRKHHAGTATAANVSTYTRFPGFGTPHPAYLMSPRQRNHKSRSQSVSSMPISPIPKRISLHSPTHQTRSISDSSIPSNVHYSSSSSMTTPTSAGADATWMPYTSPQQMKQGRCMLSVNQSPSLSPNGTVSRQIRLPSLDLDMQTTSSSSPPKQTTTTSPSQTSTTPTTPVRSNRRIVIKSAHHDYVLVSLPDGSVRTIKEYPHDAIHTKNTNANAQKNKLPEWLSSLTVKLGGDDDNDQSKPSSNNINNRTTSSNNPSQNNNDNDHHNNMIQKEYHHWTMEFDSNGCVVFSSPTHSGRRMRVSNTTAEPQHLLQQHQQEFWSAVDAASGKKKMVNTSSSSKNNSADATAATTTTTTTPPLLTTIPPEDVDPEDDHWWKMEWLSGELCQLLHTETNQYIQCNPFGMIHIHNNHDNFNKGWNVFRFIPISLCTYIISSWTHSNKYLTCNENGNVFMSELNNKNKCCQHWYIQRNENENGVFIESVTHERYLAIQTQSIFGSFQVKRGGDIEHRSDRHIVTSSPQWKKQLDQFSKNLLEKVSQHQSSSFKLPWGGDQESQRQEKQEESMSLPTTPVAATAITAPSASPANNQIADAESDVTEISLNDDEFQNEYNNNRNATKKSSSFFRMPFIPTKNPWKMDDTIDSNESLSFGSPKTSSSTSASSSSTTTASPPTFGTRHILYTIPKNELHDNDNNTNNCIWNIQSAHLHTYYLSSAKSCQHVLSSDNHGNVKSTKKFHKWEKWQIDVIDDNHNASTIVTLKSVEHGTFLGGTTLGDVMTTRQLGPWSFWEFQDDGTDGAVRFICRSTGQILVCSMNGELQTIEADCVDESAFKWTMTPCLPGSLSGPQIAAMATAGAAGVAISIAMPLALVGVAEAVTAAEIAAASAISSEAIAAVAGGSALVGAGVLAGTTLSIHQQHHRRMQDQICSYSNASGYIPMPVSAWKEW